MTQPQTIPVLLHVNEGEWSAVSQGGRLVMAGGALIARVEFDVVWDARILADSQACDVIRCRIDIADSEGRVHKTITHVSTYHLYDSMWRKGGMTMAALEQSGALKSASLAGILTKLVFWSDGRDRRIVQIIQPGQQDMQAYLIAEKYLSGEIDLCHVRLANPAEDAIDSFVIVWRSFVDHRTICEPRRDAPSPVCAVVSPAELLWGRQVVRMEEEDREYWGHPTLPVPLVFTPTDERAEPNAAVSWEKAS